MKKIKTVISMLLLCCAANIHAQTIDLSTPGLTLPQVTTALQTSLAPGDTLEGGGIDNLNYIKEFWSGRVYMNDSSGTNMFLQYHKAISRAMAARMAGTACSSGGFQGNWQIFGPDSLPGDQKIGKIDAIWADTITGDTILAGATGGLFKSTDGGANWNCITDNTYVNGGVIGIGGIAVNPLNHNTLFLGTSDMEEGSVAGAVFSNNSTLGAGIMESFDGGLSWSQEYVPITGGYSDTTEAVDKIFFSPDSQYVYAFIVSHIFARPNNPVGSWVDITPPISLDYVIWTDMQFVPGYPNHFFVSNLIGDPNAVIMESHVAMPTSSDWNEISLGLPTVTEGTDVMTATSYCRFAISMPNSDTLYALGMSAINNGNDAAFFKYSLSAETWSAWCTNIPNGGNPSLWKMNLVVSPNNTANIYYGGDIPSQSVNYGNNFIAIGAYSAPNNHADVRGMVLQKSTNTTNGVDDVLYLANDGGVGKKAAGNDVTVLYTNTVTNINGHGLVCGEFWGFGMSLDGTLMVGGMQHDGIMSYESDQVNTWEDLSDFSDAGSAGFDPAHSTGFVFEYGVLYSAIPFGTRRLGAIGGDGSLPDGPEGSQEAIYVDPSGNQYVGMHHLWELPYGGTTWIPLDVSLGLTNTDTAYIRDMVFSPYSSSLTGYVLYNVKEGSQQFEYRNPALGPYFNNLTLPGWVSSGNLANCVTMDPMNPDHALVGMSGTGTSATQTLLSLDGGYSWWDVSYGLPTHVPVGKIIFQEGTNGVVFCSTDAGIYRLDFSAFDESALHYGIAWTCFNNGAIPGTGFPNVFVTDMKINYCQGKLYAATYGRGILVSDINPPGTEVSPTNIITTNTVWSHGKQWINTSIDILPGVIFTIDSLDTVYMPKGGAIIVEPGAQLNVNNSEITNGCSQCFWQGIIAKGNPSLPQSPASNQGYVNIKGNSTITNAVAGVSNAMPDGSSSGGIIIAFSTNFVNNQNAVTLLPYTYIDPTTGAVTPYLAHFVNCTFLLDNNYKGNATGAPVFNEFVSMSGVDGVNFGGNNQFLNRDTFAAFRLKGDGIYSYNSSFGIGGVCSSILSCYPLLYPRFCGFTNGIEIENSSSFSLATGINGASFDSVSVGINVNSNNNVAATQCSFKVGHGLSTTALSADTASISLCHQNIGILLQNVPQFIVLGNDFEGVTPVFDWFNIGVAAVNTKAANTIYLNTFNQLTYGIYALGNNRLPGGNGLTVSCNTFSNNGASDIYVDPGGAPAWYGIQGTQGSLTNPAGNTFSGSAANLLNAGSNPISYYYNSAHATIPPIEKPDIVTPNVYVNGINYSNSCLPTYGVAAGPLPPPAGSLGLGHLRGHKAAFYTSKAQYQDTLAVYNGLMDYGNTDSVLNIIQGSTDTASLLAILSGGSPYISEAALNAVGAYAKLPYYSMMQLLRQNPDDLHDGAFLMNMQTDYRLDSADMDTLAVAAIHITPRTCTEQAMSAEKGAMAAEGNIIMMALKSPTDTSMAYADSTWPGICTDSTSVYYMLDSNAFYSGFDSIDTWLTNIGELWCSYERVGYYNYTGAYNTADNIYRQIRTILPAGSAADTATYKTFGRLWGAIKSADVAGRNLYSLDSVEIAGMDTTTIPVFTYNTGSKMIYALSQSLLGGGISGAGPAPGGEPLVPLCIGTETDGGRNSHSCPNNISPINNAYSRYDQFSAYPNPTNGIVTFAWNVAYAGGAVNIVITNITGETVKQLNGIGRQGSVNWDTRGMATGVYLYVAGSDSGVISKGKLVVMP